MISKIQKWGNSQGLRISSYVLKNAHIAVGDEVDIDVHDGLLVVVPRKKFRDKYNLKKLVSQIPKDYQVEEVNWGEPCGKEVW